MNIIEFWPNTSKRYNQNIYRSLDSYCSQLSSQVCANQSLSLKGKQLASFFFFIGSCPVTKRLKNLSTIQNCGKHIEAQKHLCTLIISLNCWINLNKHFPSVLYGKWEYISSVFGPLWFHYYFVRKKCFLTDKNLGPERNGIAMNMLWNEIVKTKIAP